MKAKRTSVGGIKDFCSTNTTPPTTVNSAASMCGNLVDLCANSKDVLDAEIMWCLKVIMSHYSYKSSNDVGQLFQKMFPDSAIAKNFSCSERKAAYYCHFGLAPYFESILFDSLKNVSRFTLLFDETLNQTNKKKQLDIHIRYFKEETNEVLTVYLTSVFMGHATAADIYSSFLSAVGKLDLKKLLQIGMDGPNVNWSFFNRLQSNLKKELDIECINIGSCGLHIVNNAFSKGASYTDWDVASILKALYYVFKDSPSRTEDFLNSSELKKLPLKFCNHRWLENAPVSLRAYDIWTDVTTYVTLVHNKQLPKVNCRSFAVIEEAVKDKLTPVKLLFFTSFAELLQPFLELYQGDQPLLPFFAGDIQNLIKQCLLRFKVLKKECVEKVNSSLKYLGEFNFLDVTLHAECSQVSTGFRGDKVLTKMLLKKVISDKDHLTLKKSCQKFVMGFLDNLMKKCPINYSLVRHAMALDPTYLEANPKKSQLKFKNMLLTLSQTKQIEDGVCDAVLLEFSEFQEKVVKQTSFDFKNFDHRKTRLDNFLHQYFVDGQFPKLWEIIRLVLILSHGQASVERGFSINKTIEVENLSDNSYISQRIIHDAMKNVEKIENYVITKELRMSVSSSHSKYKSFLEAQKAKETDDINTRKRNQQAEELSFLKKRKLDAVKEIASMDKDAIKLAKEAELSKDFSKLKKSNKMREAISQKTELIKELDSKILESEKVKMKM